MSFPAMCVLLHARALFLSLPHKQGRNPISRPVPIYPNKRDITTVCCLGQGERDGRAKTAIEVVASRLMRLLKGVLQLLWEDVVPPQAVFFFFFYFFFLRGSSLSFARANEACALKPEKLEDLQARRWESSLDCEIINEAIKTTWTKALPCRELDRAKGVL